MSDQDNLRDRIAQALANHDNPGYLDRDEECPMWNEYQAAAQAIIDDLGLTVEVRHIFGQAEESRNVGKWERRE